MLLRNLAFLYCAVALAVLTGGCTATPDLSGWSESATTLRTSFATEHNAILKRFNENIAEMKRVKKSVLDIESTEKVRDNYAAASKDITAALEAMNFYAKELAQQAAQGETGSAAAEKISHSLGRISSLFEKTLPLASPAAHFTREIVGTFHRMQTQNALAEGMTEMQPRVDHMAKLLSHAVQKEILKTVLDLRDLEDSIADSQYWHAADTMIKHVRTLTNEENPKHASFRKYVQQYDYQAALTEVPELGLNPNVSTTLFLGVKNLRENQQRHQRQRDQAKDWTAQRKQSLAAIPRQIEQWRANHAQAEQILRQCGGWRSLKPLCGNLSLDQWALHAQRIQKLLQPIPSAQD